MRGPAYEGIRSMFVGIARIDELRRSPRPYLRSNKPRRHSRPIPDAAPVTSTLWVIIKACQAFRGSAV